MLISSRSLITACLLQAGLLAPAAAVCSDTQPYPVTLYNPPGQAGYIKFNLTVGQMVAKMGGYAPLLQNLRYVANMGNNTYGESFDDMVYLWENFYDAEQKLINMEISFFEKNGKQYDRFSETHVQKAYEVDEIRALLEKTGYENIKIHSDFEREEGWKKDSHRIFFSCRK